MTWVQRLAEVQALRLVWLDQQRQLLRECLDAHEWNLNAASKSLGIHRSTASRWLERYPELESEYDKRKRQGWPSGRRR